MESIYVTHNNLRFCCEALRQQSHWLFPLKIKIDVPFWFGFLSLYRDFVAAIQIACPVHDMFRTVILRSPAGLAELWG